jgi:hypothetical protein
LKDGTVKTDRIELADGGKPFDVTKLPDGTIKTARIESANGEKKFDGMSCPRCCANPNESFQLSFVVRLQRV